MLMRKAGVMLLTNLLKQLQAVCVVVISKVDNSSLAAVSVERLPQPPQGQIPLHGPPGNSGIPGITPQLIVPGRLDIEVGVVEPCFSEESRYKRRSPLRVLHQDPVQVGHMEQSVRQTCQLCLLHWPAVGGSDDMDGGQDVGPGWRPAVDILCAHHLHDVPVLQ